MSRSHNLLKFLRKVHLYFGLFISPALVFFAFTGAYQSLNLHETSAGSSYKPPEWMKELAQLHKKQTTEIPVRRTRPAGGDSGGLAGPSGPAGPGGPPNAATRLDQSKSAGQGATGPAQSASQATPQPKNHMPMKIFFVLVSLGLFVSTATGVFMAYKYSRKLWVISGWLAAGVVLPLLLLPF